MDRETGVERRVLLPLEDFRVLADVDGRDDGLSRFCLAAATAAIERYCRRRLLRRKCCDYFDSWRMGTYPAALRRNKGYVPMSPIPYENNIPRPLCGEVVDFTGGYSFTLREYPVRRVFSVSIGGDDIPPENYSLIPDARSGENIPFTLALGTLARPLRNGDGIRVCYAAGYKAGKAPPDLASACFELAVWNMGRYKGRRVGTSGNVRRGSGNEGEHFEASMPENVKQLLEPYVRRTI